ncbi:hypothetical protein JK628_02470 [Shewanella sp. KX20019]|uniref:hypothetical protein n=1 Tax=Shewanella sp. KX20019 TaxID=2803864 RepID=UPI001926CC50|nr:hypothetical protein [Shewanella sp. KX20019]QQX80758.1 hypothetical protein JK628_02470 [Shewanella sp. KX20019]
MAAQVDKTQRNSRIIKAFMIIVALTHAIGIYQSSMTDWGQLAGTIAVLAFLRGLLLSPSCLVTPINLWFSQKISFSQASYKYFLLAMVLMLVSAI